MIANVLELLQRTRQHHGIEHATLHVLTARHPSYRFTGYSDPLGFFVLGDIDEQTLRHAVGEALLRLQAGEYGLARHPNCGTNLVTSAVLLALIALFASTKRSLLERFVITLIGVVPSMVVGRNLGMYFQGYTTSAEVSDRWVAAIHPFSIGGYRLHRVLFD